MSLPPSGSRAYGQPVGSLVNGVMFLYDPNVVFNGVVGGYRAATVLDLGGNTGNATFTPFFSGFSGQSVIPAGVRSYSISAVSGNVWINGGGPVIAPLTVVGGGYGALQSSAPIVIGASGGAYVVYRYDI